MNVIQAFHLLETFLQLDKQMHSLKKFNVSRFEVSSAQIPYDRNWTAIQHSWLLIYCVKKNGACKDWHCIVRKECVLIQLLFQLCVFLWWFNRDTIPNEDTVLRAVIILKSGQMRSSTKAEHLQREEHVRRVLFVWQRPSGKLSVFGELNEKRKSRKDLLGLVMLDQTVRTTTKETDKHRGGDTRWD